MLGGMMQSIGVGGTVETSELNLLSGNVGIGTTAPTQKLTIYGGGATGQIRMGYSDASSWSIGREMVNTGDFVIVSGASSEKMRIDSSGNVGIGTTNPSAKLHIVGDSILIATSQSPASNGTGVQGEISWDASYLYICTATNTWKRTALTGGY